MYRRFELVKTIIVVLFIIGWLAQAPSLAQQKRKGRAAKQASNGLTYEKPQSAKHPASHTNHQASENHPESHANHANHQAAGKPNQVIESYPDELKISKISRLPNQFVGNVVYSPEVNRLWLLSYGPPANTKGPSVLYELDPVNGKVITQTTMPFLGEFGAPAYLDNVLYVGIPYEAKIYKVSLDKKTPGQILGSIPVPSLADLKLNEPDEPYRFPFLSFSSVLATPDKSLVLVADDTGYFVHLDKESGKILKKTPTIKGLDGAAVVSHGKEINLIIANQDPEAVLLKSDARRFMFRARHGFTPPYAIRTETPCQRYGARDINWNVLDPETGEMLSSTFQSCSRASAGSVSPISHQSLPGTRYGQFKFYAIGDEGLVTVEWIPK
jgi:hypothetical protein